MAARDPLALRPTSVQRRFGDSSRTLVLSGVDQVNAAVEAGVSLCALEVVRIEVLPGVLRAAEELDIALQLVVDADWSSQADASSAIRLSAAMVRCADAARYSGPLVLATVVDGAVVGLARDHACSQLLALVDAGFTSFLFPMPQDSDELDATCELMGMVGDLALGVEVIDLPAGAEEQAHAVFQRCGMEPCSYAPLGAERAQLAVAGSLVPLQRAGKVMLRGESYLAMIARQLDVDVDEAGFAPIDTFAAERIEAVSYAEARRQMRSAQLLGGSSSCLAALSWLD